MSDSRIVINDTRKIILDTDEQKRLFKEYINSIFTDNKKFVALLVTNDVWRAMTDEMRVNFMDNYGSFKSNYKWFSKIPLCAAVKDDVEELLLRNPDILMNGILVPESESGDPVNSEYKSILPLTWISNHFHDWAMAAKERAQFVVNTPTLYPYSKEVQDIRENLNSAPLFAVFSPLSTIGGIVITLSVLTLPANASIIAAVALLFGGTAFLVMGAAYGYLYYKAHQDAKKTPLSDVANEPKHKSEPESDNIHINEQGDKPSQPLDNQAHAQVVIKENLGPDAADKPFKLEILIGPFFQQNNTGVNSTEMETKYDGNDKSIAGSVTPGQ